MKFTNLDPHHLLDEVTLTRLQKAKVSSDVVIKLYEGLNRIKLPSHSDTANLTKMIMQEWILEDKRTAIEAIIETPRTQSQ